MEGIGGTGKTLISQWLIEQINNAFSSGNVAYLSEFGDGRFGTKFKERLRKETFRIVAGSLEDGIDLFYSGLLDKFELLLSNQDSCFVISDRYGPSVLAHLMVTTERFTWNQSIVPYLDLIKHVLYDHVRNLGFDIHTIYFKTTSTSEIVRRIEMREGIQLNQSDIGFLSKLDKAYDFVNTVFVPDLIVESTLSIAQVENIIFDYIQKVEIIK